MEFIPALHARTYEEYITKLETIEASNYRSVHIDSMDGQFVPNLTVGISEIASVGTDLMKEVHLMDRMPLAQIPSLQVLGVNRVLLHRETVETIAEFTELFQQFKAVFKEVGIAYLPDTQIDVAMILELQPAVVHILGNHPADMGSPLLPMTVDRAAYWYQALPGITLSVEGSLTDEAIRDLQRAGVKRFIVASHQLMVSGESTNFAQLLQGINLEGGV